MMHASIPLLGPGTAHRKVDGIPGWELLLPTGRTGVNKSLKSGFHAYHIMS